MALPDDAAFQALDADLDASAQAYTARSKWPNLPFYTAVHIVGIVGLVITLYMTLQIFKPNSYRRALMAFAGIAFIEYWPIWVGDTGLPTLNFGVPALGFLVSLHIVDIFLSAPSAVPSRAPAGMLTRATACDLQTRSRTGAL